MALQGGSVSDGETHIATLEYKGVEFLLRGEQQVPLASIEGKRTCLYFSANWCRPCRNFTPHLVNLYNTLKNQGKNFEVVFISFDHDEQSFMEHFKHMPWLAVPYDVNRRKRLCKYFNINRIPSLIPLAYDGKNVEEDAVQIVEDYGLDAYPFGTKRRLELEAMDKAKLQGCDLEELLGCRGRDYLISSSDAKVPIANLMGKTVGLYFGAHWCPPCRTFAKMLVEVYKELNSSQTANFEVVFLSTDRNHDEFQSSLKSMPWLAVPYNDRTRHDLTRIFNVKGIPNVVILGPEGKVINPEGRALISLYGAMAFPFTESRISELEAKLKKLGEALPRQVKYQRHEHELLLDMARAYVCDACKQQGRCWVFSCDQCNFDLHPSCVSENHDLDLDDFKISCG